MPEPELYTRTNISAEVIGKGSGGELQNGRFES